MLHLYGYLRSISELGSLFEFYCYLMPDSYHPEEESESDESVESSSQEDNEIGDNEIDNVEDDVHVHEKSSDSPKEVSVSFYKNLTRWYKDTTKYMCLQIGSQRSCDSQKTDSPT